MTDTLTVAIAICTRNRAASLVETIRSVFADVDTSSRATDRALELIVVDNASTDDTAARVRALQEGEPRLRYVSEPTVGIAPARNRAINETAAAIVLFIDDDESVVPGNLDAHLEVLDAYPACVAVGGAVDLRFETSRPRWMAPRFDTYLSAFPLAPDDRKVVPREGLAPFGLHPFAGNLSLRRQALLDVGGFDPTLGRVDLALIGGEETMAVMVLREHGGEIRVTGAARVLHHVPASRTRFRWMMRRAMGQGRTEERIDAKSLAHNMSHLVFGGLRFLVDKRSFALATFAEYLVQRGYWLGRLTEHVARRVQRS